ncbi:hypothetical protein D9M68_438210 [compost metagenome]
MITIKRKLQQFELIDASFNYFSQMDYHRDFMLYIEVSSLINIKIRLIGVVSLNYTSRVILNDFNMDEKLLLEDLKPPYNGYHWGIRGFGITNWEIDDNSEDLVEMQKNYAFKLYRLTFEVNSSLISFIFHDLDIEEIE